jgi:RNA-directed DNA polymerase
MAWARRRHPTEGRRQIVSRYWRLPQWTFAPPRGPSLFEHDRTRTVRHIKVLGGKSPFDGDWVYWAGRQGYYPGVSWWLARLLKQQRGRCTHCGLYFLPTDLLEVHHRRKGEPGQRLAVLHRHCHDGVRGPGTRDPP